MELNNGKKSLQGMKVKLDEESVEKVRQQFKKLISEITQKSFTVRKIEEILGDVFEPTKNDNGTYSIMMQDVLKRISSKWLELQEDDQKGITKLLIGEESKHYIGDTKYVLYQYVSDMNLAKVSFRCGSYAYDKIKNMSGGFTATNIDNNIDNCELNLNGEKVTIWLNNNLDKKQIIISPNKIYGRYGIDFNEVGINDIVLYFA